MKLGVALSNELRVLDYLERYVNDGSASGFTLHDQLSSKTNPLGMEPFFHPLSVASEEHEIERAFSELFECPDELLDILAHPDAKAELAEVGVSTNRQSSIRLVPTSSGRTSRILDDRRGYFVKLHYPGVLGRINRSFPEHKALAGIDVSDEIALAISDGLITNKIGIMPEVGAAILRTRSPKDFSFAHVVRRLAAYPESESCARLPLFSLWSFDRMAPLDKPLIEQMANSDARRTLDISSEIAKSLVDFFFEAWNSLGYIYEINAQNVLVEIDSRLILRRVILRDFNSTEKDLARRAEISRPTTFRSGNYKVLDINDLDTLHIRRSFAFDFKFCNYVVSPLLEALARVDQTLAEEFLGSVRDHVADALGRMPVEFFHPNGTWWAHPEMELTDSRPYVQFSNPMLR